MPDDADLQLVLAPPDWTDRAACRDVPDPELFHPAGLSPAFQAQVDEAVGYCVDCPVLAECLATAEAHEAHGVWAGRLYNKGNPVGRLRGRGRPRKDQK